MASASEMRQLQVEMMHFVHSCVNCLHKTKRQLWIWWIKDSGGRRLVESRWPCVAPFLQQGRMAVSRSSKVYSFYECECVISMVVNTIWRRTKQKQKKKKGKTAHIKDYYTSTFQAIQLDSYWDKIGTVYTFGGGGGCRARQVST